MHQRTKRPNETITYQVEFARALENTWHAGYEYDVTDYVRPTVVNGFEYECTNPGQSSQAEPDWPAIIDTVFEDGSVTWTCRDFTGSASDSISSRLVTADPGVTIETDTIEDTRISFTVSGGSNGMAYKIRIEVTTAAGDVYEEQVRLVVKE